MDKIYSFIPKKTLTLIIFLLVIIIALAAILFLRQPKSPPPSPLPVISQSPVTISPLQKTLIGRTKPEDVEKTYQIKDKKTLPNGDLSYSINSKLDARPDQIIFHNSAANFERIIVVGNEKILKLSDQILKYGPAEKVLKASKYYGNHMETHIYASKGFAFIVNPNADEIYEIQTFSPTSLDNYLTTYGEDIVGEVKPVGEEFVNGTQ